MLPHVTTRSTRGVYTHVYPNAIAHNLAQLRATFIDRIAPCIWATVKADAYGMASNACYRVCSVPMAWPCCT